MKKTVFALFLFVASAVFVDPAMSQDDGELNPERAFYRANMYYEAGEYERAIEENEKILERGLRSGNLYYNLGNCYFKNGELGKAVLNYKRAARYIPTDSDLRSNYRYAVSLMKQRDPQEKRLPFTGWLDRAMSYLTMGQGIALALVIFYAFVVILIAIHVFKRAGGFLALSTWILGAALVLVLIPLCYKALEHERSGIVVNSIVDARFEPIEDATVHFPLYEGMMVYVLRERAGWYKIRRPDGRIGWVPGSSLERV